MSENMSPTGLVIDGAIFINEMLSYVHRVYYGISRVSLIPAIYLNTHREFIDIIFHHELGDAIVKRLLILPRNHAANLTACANRIGFTDVHLANLLRFHRGAYLTDEDFRRYGHAWSCILLDWLALLATVCFLLERNGDGNELLRAVIVAGEILCNVMSGNPFRKMRRLREYARIFTSANPRLIVNY